MQNFPLLISTIVKRIPAVLPHLNANALEAVKAGYAQGGLAEITSRYNNEIVSALTTYLEGGSITSPSNQFNQAMTEAFNSAFDTGWIDGGGELPVDGEAIAWLQEKIQTELGHISDLFEQAKELRGKENYDFFSWVTARADGYRQTLNSIYAQAKMLAGRSVYEWVLGATEKHCSTCKRLANGVFRKAKWYIERGYIPKMPGASMECGGYNCDCALVNKNGDLWSG